MKLLAYLKVTLKGIIREFPAFFLSYALYPMIIALVMGYVQKDMFTPAINDPIFSIIIVDEDNTSQSQNLVSFLNGEELAKLMNVEPSDTEKFDYTLRIPNGYENSLTGESLATVKVEAEEKSSTTIGNILVSIIDKYNIEASQRIVIQRNIDNNPLSKEEKKKTCC